MFKTYNDLINFAKKLLDKNVHKERHHIIPRYKGGSNTLENIVNVKCIK